MKLEINGKEYELEFGLKFIHEMDNIYTQRLNGVEFGMGLEMMGSYLNMRNPLVLLSVIKAGTAHLKSKPKQNDIEKFLEEKAEKNEFGRFFDEVEEVLVSAPFLKDKLKRMKTASREAQKEARKNQ